MRWKLWLASAALAVGAAACTSWPETKMVPVEDYAMAATPTVSGQPAYTAGPSYVTTTGRDGSTFVLTCDGRMLQQVSSLRQTC